MDKLILERRFRRLGNPGAGEPSDTVTLQQVESKRVVVVLGEPGSGKTTQLKREAERCPGARYLSVRTFLHSALNNPPPETLLLDGLDEVRASRSDRVGALDETIRRLLQLNPIPKVRLSCRAAEWLGGLDRSRLEEAFPGEILVIELVPLSPEETKRLIQAAGLEDPDTFLETARRQRMTDWLNNPHTLELMIEVARQGELPSRRRELFERACVGMAEERNREHRVAKQGLLNPEAILDAAGYLCAVALIGGLEGFVLDPDEVAQDFALTRDLRYPEASLIRALESRLFRTEQGRVVPVHRTIAEFLAARYLRERVESELPIERLLRLVTGHDGGTLSDLRGLYAWLGSLVTQHASLLARRDPVALIFFGDPGLLPPSAKRTVLHEIEHKVVAQNPWFFYEGPVSAFGALADVDLIPDFRAILADPERPRYLVLAILATLAYGPRIQGLGQDLLRLIQDSHRPSGTRELALKAALVQPGIGTSHLIAVLDAVHSGSLEDENDSLRGQLLKHLYPETFTARELVHYLSPPKAEWPSGDYASFVKQLARQAPNSDLPELLDGLAGVKAWSPSKRAELWQALVGTLLFRGIELHGELAPEERLWSWFRCGFNLTWSIIARKGEGPAIRDWLSAKPDLLMRMYRWWTREGDGAAGVSGRSFWGTLGYPKIPADLWRWQLSEAEALVGDQRGIELFREVVLSMGEEAGPPLDELFTWVERHQEFEETLRPLLTSPCYWGHFPTPENDEIDEDAETRAENRSFIDSRLDQVRVGDDLRILGFLAGIFLDATEGELAGLDAITKEYGAEIAAAATEGFAAVLRRSDVPTPEQIGESSARTQETLDPLGLSLQAGMVDAMDKGVLPDLRMSSAARAALAFEFAEGIYGSEDWRDELIKRDPQPAAAIARAAWLPRLRLKPREVPHLFQMDTQEALRLVAREIGQELLEQFSRAHERLLRELMRAALVGGDADALAALALSQVQRPQGLNRDQYILWLAIALLVSPEASLPRVRQYLKRDRTPKAYYLAGALKDLSMAGRYSIWDALPAVLADLIRLLGEACPPQQLTPKKVDFAAFKAAEFVDRLIDTLGARTDAEAVGTLLNLSQDRTLALRREKIAHVAELQRRKVREEGYSRPPIAQVVQVLQAGSPVNVADLHATVCDHLRSLQQEIEIGPENGYRSFWNLTDQHGRSGTPLPETEARNRLLLLFNPRLRPSGISAEPEGPYAVETRADIKIWFQGMNLPIEVKNHFNREIWTAPREQLLEKYSRDPGAEGYGIYVVFWFGEAAGRLPRSPGGISTPTSAAELEDALRALYSGEEFRRTEFICLDCSLRGTETRLGKRCKR